MKVVLVTPWYPHEKSPVEGIFIHDHARAIRMAHTLRVVHLGWPGPTSLRFQLKRETVGEVPVLRIGWPNLPRTDLYSPILSFLVALKALKRDGFRPDLVNAHVFTAAFAGAFVARLHRIPLVATEHASTFSSNNPERPTWSEVFRARFAWGRAAAVLPVGSILAESVKRYAPSAAVRVVPEPVDCDLFRPATNRVPYAGRLISVALLLETKGIQDLINAVARLKTDGWRGTLEVIGDGTYRTELVQLVRRVGLEEEVRFLGLLPKAAIADRLREADIFVLPSHFETFCAAAAEAIASGLPVIMTRCGGPEDFVNPTVGCLTRVGDVEELANAIRHVEEHIDSFDPWELAQYARERFSLERVSQSLSEVFASAIGRYA